ncbi:ATP-dependent Clp protease proteolytic subunit [Ceratocystis lukuohia]|uniref:ATP-dependent Clp protease proteolytic subunit n=2 Tax=Ceratocystis TaxID=5157 RepID=A0A2C5XF64_9PEZI|nr:ATP-dependent Clp protease proteolytic subunit [Ceratocystis fimbriata CBS 114723]
MACASKLARVTQHVFRAGVGASASPSTTARGFSTTAHRAFTDTGRAGLHMPPTSNIPMPYITEVTTGGWRTYDIFSRLLQERIICLNGSIDDTTSASIVSQLLWLESDSPDKTITMYINSPGGMVSAGLAIYDTMSYISSPVSTVCVGAASSMASLLLVGGARGKRYALPHSAIMVHQPLGGTQGQTSDILIYANQIQRIRDQVNEIYRTHVNSALPRDKHLSKEAVEALMERDNYMTAQEALANGVIDEVLVRRTEDSKGDNTKGPAPASAPS